MRERYETSFVVELTREPRSEMVPPIGRFLDIGDGTCILMSDEEYQRRITPADFLAQEEREDQEDAAAPRVPCACGAVPVVAAIRYRPFRQTGGGAHIATHGPGACSYSDPPDSPERPQCLISGGVV